MFEIIVSGGWVMAPLILCSIIAVAIVAERLWSLQRKRICPPTLVGQIWQWAKNGQLDSAKLSAMRGGSPLGKVLAAGLLNMRHEREVMKESIEEAGRHVVHELERFLTLLGTIAVISPLLGLLGTVVGMISTFNIISTHGVGNPAEMASGISVALITTATGLLIAIPSVVFHRFFQRRVDELVVVMEQEALKMVEVLHGERERDTPEDTSK